MVLSGYAVLVAMPALTTAWVGHLGIAEADAGTLAAADLGGFALGAMLASWLLTRSDRRWTIFLAATVAALANLACVGVQSPAALGWLRGLAGASSGLYAGAAVAALGAGSNPVRNYGWALFAFAFAQGFELTVLPRLSMAEIYLFFAGTHALILPFVRWMPSRAAPNRVDSPQSASPRAARWVLVAILCTYLGVGAYWSYVELGALDAALEPSWVSRVLVGASVSSLGACVVSGVLRDRLGSRRTLVGTLLAHGLVIGMLASGIDGPRFALSVLGFGALWMLADIYQLGRLAELDERGVYAALVPAAQGVGLIGGPLLGGAALALGWGYSAVFSMSACASLLASAIHISLHSSNAARAAER